MAKTFDGKRVSRRWHRVLTAARKDGVRFLLTSGRRTLAEQWALWRNPPRDANGRPVPVAYPNPNAPHIRVGRQDHAIDVNALDGGETRLQAWLTRHGVLSTNPVAGEAWHLEAPGGDLKRLADKLRGREKRRRRRERLAELVRRLRVRKVGKQGMDLITEFEGFARVRAAHGPDLAFPYQDPVGVWTIGYGETKGIGPTSAPWTREQARRTLRTRLNRDYAPAVRALKVPLTQAQFDALCSFAYNLGPGALSNNTGIGRALRERQWQRAADEMLKWDKAGGRVLAGLTRRRHAERRLFLSDLP
jgi:GH24 family phage-related lysozyme (muramidase)